MIDLEKVNRARAGMRAAADRVAKLSDELAEAMLDHAAMAAALDVYGGERGNGPSAFEVALQDDVKSFLSRLVDDDGASR